MNCSIRARKHVHVAVNGACAEIRPVYEQGVHLGCRENSQESRTRKETRGRGVWKQFPHFSFWANSRTVQNGKHNERGQI